MSPEHTDKEMKDWRAQGMNAKSTHTLRLYRMIEQKKPREAPNRGCTRVGSLDKIESEEVILMCPNDIETYLAR